MSSVPMSRAVNPGDEEEDNVEINGRMGLPSCEDILLPKENRGR